MRVRQTLPVDEEREHDRWTATESEQWFVRARLHLLTNQEGGRTAPIASGYRSHWTFPPEVHDDGQDGPLTFERRPGAWLQPGEQTIVRLHPLAPHLWPTLSPGLRLTMKEGARVVGTAEVIEVVAPRP
jgi:translation elongation factor EF-Tu-like GTPase